MSGATIDPIRAAQLIMSRVQLEEADDPDKKKTSTKEMSKGLSALGDEAQSTAERIDTVAPDGEITADELALFLAEKQIATTSLIIYDTDGNAICTIGNGSIVEGADESADEPTAGVADEDGFVATASGERADSGLLLWVDNTADLLTGNETIMFGDEAVPIRSSTRDPQFKNIDGKKRGDIRGDTERCISYRHGEAGVSRQKFPAYLRAFGLDPNNRTARELMRGKDWMSLEEIYEMLKTQVLNCIANGQNFGDFIEWRLGQKVNSELLGDYLESHNWDEEWFKDLGPKAERLWHTAMNRSRLADPETKEMNYDYLAMVIMEEFFDRCKKFIYTRGIDWEDPKVLQEFADTLLTSVDDEGEENKIIMLEAFLRENLPERSLFNYLRKVSRGRIDVELRPIESDEISDDEIDATHFGAPEKGDAPPAEE